MNLLAIDTCTDGCSAALLCAGEIRERFQHAPRRHAELILPMAQALLAEAGLMPAQLDAVAFSRGPGAFTGVRVGVAVAHGIALGADLPLVPISTLAALARRGAQSAGLTHVSAALDARMGQVYIGLYRQCGAVLEEVLADRVASPQQVLDGPDVEWAVIGSGWDAYPEALGTALPGRLAWHLRDEHPHAEDVAALGATRLTMTGGVSVEDALPVYLRDRVVGS